MKVLHHMFARIEHHDVNNRQEGYKIVAELRVLNIIGFQEFKFEPILMEDILVVKFDTTHRVNINAGISRFAER